MPKTESTQQKLSRVRAPRVHLVYDVEVGGAMEQKELPFVVGVLGDFSAASKQPATKLKERKFIEIDRDNFDEVLAGLKPRIAFRVDNKLTDEEGTLAVELNFKNMEDFEPDQVVQQVTPLRQLVEARQRLSDLVSKMDGNDKLEELLNQVLENKNDQLSLSNALGIEAANGAKEGSNE